MKKAIVFIVMFAVVAFSTTAFLIYRENGLANENEVEVSSGDEKAIDEELEEVVPKEKTLDLYGRYNQNDLEFLSDTLVYNDKEYEIAKISGLKNKDVENKINESIREKIINGLDEISKKDLDKTYEINIYWSENANFSNIFSSSFYINYRLNKAYEYKYDNERIKIPMNYELVNGNELKVEDLFVNNVSLHDLVRRAMYNELSSTFLLDEIKTPIEYNSEKKIWEYGEYDYKVGGNVIKEYESGELDEIELSQKMNEYLNSKNKEFSFTHAKVYFTCQGNDYWLWLKDIADKVVIYDKYVTSESIYERDDIGLKNILTCASPSDNVVYQEYKFKQDNLFYDITVLEDYSSHISKQDFIFADAYKVLKEKILNQANEELEDYALLARENPQNLYLLLMKPQVLCFVNSSWDSNLNKWNNDYTNLMATSLEIKIIEIENCENKDEIIEELYSAYRYHNLAFYGGVYDYCHFAGDNIKTSVNYVYNMYNAETLEEIKAVHELFVDGFDYENYLKNKMREMGYSEEELNFDIIFKPFTFYIREDNYDYDQHVMDLSSFNKNLLKIKWK